MGFLNAMRFKSLSLMATFWVLSGVQGEDILQTQDKKTGETFTTEANSFTSIGSSTTGSLDYQLTITARNATIPNTTLFLCQATSNGLNITATRIGAYCIGDICPTSPDKEPAATITNAVTPTSTGTIFNVKNDVPSSMKFSLTSASTNQSYLFLCFTNAEGSCTSTSKAFQFPGQIVELPIQSPSEFIKDFKPTEHRSDNNPVVLPLGATALPSVSTTFARTVVETAQPTSTGEPAAEPTATPVQASSGLSTGAKAGIAVGALGVAIIILLGALLCLRRRHRRTSAPDQIMLNQSSADSHDLITEKETERNSPQSYEAPTPVYGANLNVSPKSQTRHSALSPYEEIPSQPYTGSAAAIPRRKPTLSPKSTTASSSTNKAATAAVATATTGAIASSSTVAPSISREVSAASTIGPSSRGTPPITNESSPPTNRDFEEYRDVPTTYADRHTPQVFEGGLQAPFLGSESNISRESMSEADLARLTEEEEERRIDAAIEEAERKRRP